MGPMTSDEFVRELRVRLDAAELPLSDHPSVHIDRVRAGWKYEVAFVVAGLVRMRGAREVNGRDELVGWLDELVDGVLGPHPK